MSRFDDYPYSQFREAFGTVLGRLGLISLAVLGGSMLGGLTAYRSIAGLWEGVVGLPGLSLASIFFGVGFFVLPVLLIYAIVSIRCEWPLRLTVICTLLMWWNIHKTIRWVEFDSPSAKQRQEMKLRVDKIESKVAKQTKPRLDQR